MRICFVLPRMAAKAVGGYKIVYEYANRFVEKGHSVSILYLNTNYFLEYHVPRFVKKAYFDFLNISEPKWFELNKKIDKISDYSADVVDKLLNETEVAVATAVRTAPYVAENFKTTNKVYLIQDRENWDKSDEFVDNTYKLGMKNVVISNWLKEIVDNITGKESVLIRNPIDLAKYKVVNPVQNRKV